MDVVRLCPAFSICYNYYRTLSKFCLIGMLQVRFYSGNLQKGYMEVQMTNIFGTAGKISMKKFLFQTGIDALQKDGWKVERDAGNGKSSVRRITKKGESKLVSIRTTQDTYIAFPRNKTDTNWKTLSDVDAVVAVSVDDRYDPKFAKVHFLPGQEMRRRFDQTYAARMKADHSIPLGRGVWLSLYEPEAKEPPRRVGAGAGLVHPPIATVPLAGISFEEENETAAEEMDEAVDEPLTIPEAKRRLAHTLGVPESAIKITVEG